MASISPSQRGRSTRVPVFIYAYQHRTMNLRAEECIRLHRNCHRDIRGRGRRVRMYKVLSMWVRISQEKEGRGLDLGVRQDRVDVVVRAHGYRG